MRVKQSDLLGQGPLLHATSCSVSFPKQDAPPYWGFGLLHSLVRFSVPCPHVALQGVEIQADQPPSTAVTQIYISQLNSNKDKPCVSFKRGTCLCSRWKERMTMVIMLAILRKLFFASLRTRAREKSLRFLLFVFIARGDREVSAQGDGHFTTLVEISMHLMKSNARHISLPVTFVYLRMG